MTEFDPVALLRVLTEHRVRFVVIGGVAARLHGAPLLTQDIDITPARDDRNLEDLAVALRELKSRLRVPHSTEGVPIPVEAEMLRVAQSWTLTTKFGDLDLVFRPAGSDGYADLVRNAIDLAVVADGTLVVAVAALEDIIRTKEAAGRTKDHAALPMLRETLQERLRGA